MNIDTSYLSIVVTARNDDHGGNLINRMQLFLTALLEQCQRHQLSAELVLVEWNPPPDRPRLAQALKWPEQPGPCAIRIIEVPPRIHQRYKYSDKMALFQMIAKNVGIRRARGQFVLATNIDILFANELIEFLASGGLEAGKHYRVDRYDVPANVPTNGSIEEQLGFCVENAFRVNRRDGTFYIHASTSNGGHERIRGIRPRIFRYLRWPYRLLWLLTLVLLNPRRFVAQFGLYMKQFGRRTAMKKARLHTNACGDFALMSRGHWFNLRGYPELEVFSLHLDSLLCYLAHHARIREVVLDYPIFHIEHSSGWSPETAEETLSRVQSKGIPILSNQQLSEWDLQMMRQHKPIVFNSENWGLADEDLPETTIIAAVTPNE